MKEMSSQKKACLAINIAWTALGALLLTFVLTIGNRNPAARPMLTILVNAYITALPIVLIIQAVIRRKNLVLTIVGGALVFAFALLLLW